MKRNILPADPDQLGFDALLVEAETVNRAAVLVKRLGHLPGTMDEALPLYRAIIDRHHASMMAGDLDTALKLRDDAHNLALRLNHGEPGILAGPDAPGCALARSTAAPQDTIPFWGQTGSFVIVVGAMQVRIDMDGIFGIGASTMPWMNFCAHAVDWDRPFLSETGYRSFLGLHTGLVPGLTPDAFAVETITAHVKTNLKGRLVPIQMRVHRLSDPL